MHVAMVNRMAAITRGGGEIWDLQVAERLDRGDVDVTVVTGAPLRGDVPDPVERVESRSVRTPHLLETAHALPPGPAGALADLDLYLFARRCRATVRDLDPDVLYVNAWPQLARLRRVVDAPTVLKLNGPPHSLLHDVVDPFSDSYDRLEAFDAVVTTGVTTETVAERSGVEPVEINPGVDTSRFRPAPVDADDASSSTPLHDAGGDDVMELLFVGRFVPAKDLPSLLDAVERVQERLDIHLTLVGGGPLRDRIARRIEREEMGGTVTLSGYVDNDDLPAYYRAADAVALSSRHENYPIVLLEAMSCGTPAIAPDVGAVDAIVTDGEDGLLYPAGDSAALADAVRKLHDDPDRRERMGERARERAVADFDWGDRTDRFEELCRSLLAD